MNKIKYFVTIVLVVFSFYLTDRVMIYIDSKNPIMKSILDKKDDYYVKAVNAVIKDNTIIPGINGKEVNEYKSFVKMEEFGSFNELYLKYDLIKPKVSLEDNKDKIIIKGNEKKRAVSFIIYNNELIEDYFNENNIKYALVANINTAIKNNMEYINGEKEHFSDLHSLLKKNKQDIKLCLKDYSLLNECQKYKYYIVNYSVDASKSIMDTLNKINSGDIIFINNSVSLDNIKLILNEINKQDLKILYVKELIAEKN